LEGSGTTISIKNSFDGRSKNHIEFLITLIREYRIKDTLKHAVIGFPANPRIFRLKLKELTDLSREKGKELRNAQRIAREHGEIDKPDYFDVKDEKYFGCLETILRSEYREFWHILTSCFRNTEENDQCERAGENRSLNLTSSEKIEKERLYLKYEDFINPPKLVFKSPNVTYPIFSEFARTLLFLKMINKKVESVSYIHSEFNPKITCMHFKSFQTIKKCRILWEEYGLKPLTLPAIWTPKVFKDCSPVLREEIRQFLYIWKATNMPKDLINYVIDRIVDLNVIV
jgi:hypothetical protein